MRTRRVEDNMGQRDLSSVEFLKSPAYQSSSTQFSDALYEWTDFKGNNKASSSGRKASLSSYSRQTIGYPPISKKKPCSVTHMQSASDQYLPLSSRNISSKRFSTSRGFPLEMSDIHDHSFKRNYNPRTAPHLNQISGIRATAAPSSEWYSIMGSYVASSFDRQFFPRMSINRSAIEEDASDDGESSADEGSKAGEGDLKGTLHR